MANTSLRAPTTLRASDNRSSSARNIGPLSGVRKFRGFVGLSDREDYFSFTLTGRSSFSGLLNKLQNNVDLTLLQGKRVVSRSARSGKKTESINTTLEAGTYFLRVNQRRGNSRYQLTLNATLLSAPTPTPTPTSRRIVSLFTAGSSPRIGSIDLNTGVRLPLAISGDAAEATLTDVAVSGSDLFVTSIQNGLFKVDATTGSSGLIGNLGVSNSSTVNALEFAPSGTLYAAGTSGGFYTVDVTTGRASLIAAIFYWPDRRCSTDRQYWLQ